MFSFIWAWLQALFGYVKLWLPEAHDSAWLGAAPAMEEEPVTVSLGPIGPLFQQLRSVIAALQGNSRRFKLKGIKAQIQILGQELEGLCIDLKGRSEAPEDALARCWMRQVRDLCYDTADYLDELMHFIHCSSGTRRRRIRARFFGGNRLGPNTLRISRGLTWPSLPKLKKLRRAPLIAKLSALVARVEDADESRKRFKLSPPTSSKPDDAQAAAVMPQIPPQLHIDKLNKLLAFDNEMEKNLKVVTIFGSVGVGKTALARTLYHQHRGRFQHRAFIRVSRDPDMRRLLTDMLSQIKAPPPHAFSDVQGLIGHITKHLQGKRYLIIINDLWSTSTWDIIIRALPAGDYCRIITTTQVEDVALACCSYQLKHIYQITPLNDDQSGKSEGGCTTYPSSEGMKEALNLVYNNLPPRLKTCLLYLNMYPEGYTLRKDELVKQWLAEDFIGSVQGQDIEDTAGCYFDTLVSSGLVQSVDTNHNGEVLSCTLHHMVLDLIRQKSMEENFVTIVNYFQTILGLPDKVRRLSVQLGGAKGANNIPENMRISQVRSLSFSGFFKCVPSILDCGLLQVLILHIWSDQDMIFDLSTIGELYRLRYLKIECNITVKLPGKIRRLRHMGTLQVDARLSAVPSDIVYLEKLLHLRLPSESILPHGVGYMISLCTLGYFDLGSNSEDNVRALDELKNLQDLHLTCSAVQPAENLEKNMQLLFGSVLQKLSNLRSVTMVPASGSCKGNAQPDYGSVSSMSISCDGFSSVVPATAHLQKLELSRRCCIFSRLPKWLGELAQLCILKIAVRELSKEDIDILKGVPALTVLWLHVATTSAEMIVFDKGGFSVLTYFKFTCTVAWLKLEADAMPNLQKLRLGFNATVVDKQGIIIEHLSGIKEISAIIGCVGVGAGSTWLKAITNDSRNPKVKWMCSIYVGDEGTGHVVTQEEAQENYRIQDKVSGRSEIMDETDGVQDEGSEPGESSEVADRNDPVNQMVHGMLLQREGLSGPPIGQKVPVWFLTPMAMLGRLLTPIISTVLAITVLRWLQHYVAAAGCAIAVVGWLVSPIIGLLLPKILAYLGFDASKKFQELEIRIIPELQNTLYAVDQARMMQRGKKLKGDVTALDKMAALLRHAREEVEDIFDDRQEIELYRSRCWHRLRRSFATCIAGFKSIIRRKSAWLLQWLQDALPVTAGALVTCKSSCVWLARLLRSGSARLLQWARKISLLRPENVLPVTTNTVAPSHENVVVTASAAASGGPVPVATNVAASDESTVPVTTPSNSSWCSSFDFFKNCCRPIFYWLVDAIEAAHFYRVWPYEVVGITGYQENATALDFALTAISRWKLKKRIEKVENTVSEVKKSPLLSMANNKAPNDIANKNRSRIRTDSDRKVFGREVLRDDIMARLREIPQGDAPSSSTSLCYSVLGIYGVAGSGKTTFARYIRDYIKEECKEKLFDTIMCIHVSENFSVDDIFHDMLKDITGEQHPNISDREELKEKLKRELRGKRFFLILDDLWVKSKNDPQLEELIYPLDVGLKGSKILVMARTKDTAGALCADKPIKMPDLDEDQYLTMFMHYALSGTRVPDEDFLRVGSVIARKLHRSPIAAVTVAGWLGANLDISFWKITAELDTLNDTMGALWWSYQQLNPDIRRCFEYCNIFPRRFELEKDKLIRLWIAQGLVKTSWATEMEDVAEGYIQELVSCSLLQSKGTSWNGTELFTVHDLLHDLAEKVSGSDYFRIENERSQRGEGWKGDVPRDVRHLFLLNYDAELITEKVPELENLRTLIIYVVERRTLVEENVIESICKRLPKLRVLAIAFSQEHGPINQPDKFLVPESIIRLKHLRYLAFQISFTCTVILPSALAKLHHIQLLDFGNGKIAEFTFADLINLRHIFCSGVNFPNLGRLSSLQTIPRFTVRNEQGYKVDQLRDLNKLCGKLKICGLESVFSKDEALEANLAAKKCLTELTLEWGYNDDTRCSPEDEAEVLEGLCPPVGLETLEICDYRGSRYPDWMVGKQTGGPKDLQKLWFMNCSQLGPGPELGAFRHLCVLNLSSCSWDTLPGNMEHLTSLETLYVSNCENIQSLPTLPRSLEWFDLYDCNVELMKSCQTVGHPNWQKIVHIPNKTFETPSPAPSEALGGSKTVKL